jgi:nucleoside-diphosphate-sugar epimerase
VTLTSSETPVLAETSYGCQKQIIELYVYDYGRKGFLETRSVRLPTVAIRSGAVLQSFPYHLSVVELTF